MSEDIMLMKDLIEYHHELSKLFCNGFEHESIHLFILSIYYFYFEQKYFHNKSDFFYWKKNLVRSLINP